MSVSPQIYRHEDVVQIYPRWTTDYKEEVKTRKMKMAQELGVTSLEKANNIYLAVMIPLTILWVLGSLFLILAAHQVLPSGINSISNLGATAYVLSYGAFGIGIVALLVSVVKLCQNVWLNSKIESKARVLKRNYEGECGEMDYYLIQRMKSHELFAIYDDFQKEIRIYFWNTDLTDYEYPQPSKKNIKYDNSPENALKQWQEKADNQTFLQGRSFIDLEMLTERSNKCAAFRRLKPRESKNENQVRCPQQ